MLGLFLALVFAVVHYTRRAHPRPMSIAASPPAPKNEWTREDQLLFISTVVLTITTSANWICSCLRLLQAYHTSGGSSPSHIEMDNTVSAAQMVFRVMTWFVADVIVISRVYVIWNGKLGIILLPALSLAVLLASGVAIAYDTAVLDSDPPDTTFANWKLVNSWSSIFTNVYCTGMITYRIVRVSRSHAQTGKSPLSAALATLVESAVFYTTIALLTYATAEAEHVSNAFFIEISAPSAALAAVVIHVRAVWRRELVLPRASWTRGRVGGGVAGVGVARGEKVGAVHSRPVAAASTHPAAASTHPAAASAHPAAASTHPRTLRHADVEAQKVGNETHHSEKDWEKKVDLEKDWETRSASDGDSSSTATLRPMPSAVVR
ncbi:hypothetical protein K525DRAFT_240424 [Schizophyllum commune Loenen D]|nr:hypothetical protein K525DRAFT_240424 [Schizophyllum commune Loenen D]